MRLFFSFLVFLRLREFMGVGDEEEGLYRDLMLDAPHLPKFMKEFFDVIEGKATSKPPFLSFFMNLLVCFFLCLSAFLRGSYLCGACASHLVEYLHVYMYMPVCTYMFARNRALVIEWGTTVGLLHLCLYTMLLLFVVFVAAEKDPARRLISIAALDDLRGKL